MTSPSSSQPASPGAHAPSPVPVGISAPSIIRRPSWRGKAAAVAAAHQPADFVPPAADRMALSPADDASRARDRGSADRQRRLHGDRYQGFMEDEESDRQAQLELGVGERLQQVPEVSTSRLKALDRILGSLYCGTCA